MGPGLCENWQLQGPQVMLLSYYPAQHPGGAGRGEEGNFTIFYDSAGI